MNKNTTKFKNKNCEIIYNNIVSLVAQLEEIRKLNPNLKVHDGYLDKEQVMRMSIKSLTELEEDIDKERTLENAYKVCAKNDIVCMDRELYNNEKNELFSLRKEVEELRKINSITKEQIDKGLANDDFADGLELAKKLATINPIFWPAKNKLKEFQRKLLEMIAVRQQNEVDKLPLHPENYMYMEIGKLKAYKDIFELVLDFYRKEKESV